MKSRILTILISGMILSSFSQTSIGIGNDTPNPKSVLDIMSNDPTNNPQGILFPRLTTTQKNLMTLGLAEKGMVVYDIDLNRVDSWNGVAWSSTLSLPSSTSIWDSLTSVGDATTNFNVGIGITNPSQALEVGGDVIIGGGSTQYDGTSEFLQFESQTNSWYVGAYNNTSPTLSDFYISTTNGGDGTFHVEASSGFVGIGTTTPNTTLTVGGTTRTDTLITKEIQLVTNAGNGKILKSDAAGNGKWEKSLAPIMILNADFLSATPNVQATSWPTPGDIDLSIAGIRTIIHVDGFNFSETTHFVQVTPNLNASMFSVVDFNGGDIEIRSYDETGSAYYTHLMVTIYEY